MINWKKVGKSIPTNENKSFPNSPETPFVSCIVWVCNPNVIKGGLIDVVRWDTKNKCWHYPDLEKKWIHQSPYLITHFSDDINIPETELNNCDDWKIQNEDKYYYASGRNYWTYVEITFWINSRNTERKETTREVTISTGNEWELPQWAKVITTRRRNLESDF